MARTRVPRTCQKCQVVFHAWLFLVNQGGGKYCSRACCIPKGPDHRLWAGGEQRRKERKKELYRLYPERNHARISVRRALRKGTLMKLPCAVCNEPKSEAHHEDYHKPLEVIWLCRRHHREADKRLGIGAKDFKKRPE